MSPVLFYYCLWILLGLVLAGLASTLLVRQLRRRVQHEAQAHALLDALSRYAVWTAAQRNGSGYGHGNERERATAAAALREARLLQARCFPALTGAFTSLLDSDRRLQALLREQQSLRVRDPEAWLDTQPLPVMEELWQRHESALRALAQRLSATQGPLAG